MLQWLKMMIEKNNIPHYEKILELEIELRDLSFKQWYHDDFDKWTWWLNLALSIIPWYIWWKIVDRKRIMEILIYGFLVALIASFFDVIGSEFVLWGYPDRLLSNIPRLLPADYTLIPIAYMLVYQYFPSGKAFVIANIILAALIAFIAEPLFVLFDFYTMITWKYYYSFPIYFGMSVLSRWVVERVKTMQGYR